MRTTISINDADHCSLYPCPAMVTDGTNILHVAMTMVSFCAICMPILDATANFDLLPENVLRSGSFSLAILSLDSFGTE